MESYLKRTSMENINMQECKVCGKKVKKEDLYTVTNYYYGDKVSIDNYCSEHKPDMEKDAIISGKIYGEY